MTRRLQNWGSACTAADQDNKLRSKMLLDQQHQSSGGQNMIEEGEVHDLAVSSDAEPKQPRDTSTY